MATLYITEYEHLAMTFEPSQIAKEPRVTGQTVAIGGSSTQSSAFNTRTRFIRVHTDAICSFVISTSPTAAATDARMAASTTEYFGVTPGDKLAVITNT